MILFKSKKFIFLAVFLILGALAYSSYQKNKDVVKVRKIETNQIVVKRTVSASGTVKAVNEANIAFPSLGKITYLSVEEGDPVKKYQYLGQIYNLNTQEAAISKKATEEAVRRDRDLFVENFKTNMQAFGGADEYKIELRRQNKLVDKASADTKAAEALISNSMITAPFNGTVIDVLYDQGEVALAGSTILTIADLNELIFEIELDQEDFGLLTLGQEVGITLDSYENHTFIGFVEKMPFYAESSDTSGGDFIVEIKVSSDPKFPILMGMAGDANIVLKTSKEKVTALEFDQVNYDRDGSAYIWVADSENVLSKLPVELGLEGDFNTEIKSTIVGTIIINATPNVLLEEGNIAKFED